MYPDNLKYSEEHEWVQIEDDVVTIGISHHAQEALGEIVYVGDLFEVGDTFNKGDVGGSIESVKAVSDIYLPVGGEVVEVNEALEDDPATINNDPYGEGWLYRVKLNDDAELDELMESEAYQTFLQESE